jgi:hypothetical protein
LNQKITLLLLTINVMKGKNMNETKSIVGLAFRLVAMAMAAVTIALVVIEVGGVNLYIVLLAIGLFFLPVGSLIERG